MQLLPLHSPLADVWQQTMNRLRHGDATKQLLYITRPRGLPWRLRYEHCASVTIVTPCLLGTTTCRTNDDTTGACTYRVLASPNKHRHSIRASGITTFRPLSGRSSRERSTDTRTTRAHVLVVVSIRRYMHIQFESKSAFC